MNRALILRNRQRTRSVQTRLLRRIAEYLLADVFQAEQFELGIHLVTAKEITRLNQAFLAHEGGTDVITFDHAEKAEQFHGEIFICIDEAVSQAKKFRTSWQAELVRYLIHGLLHLRGFDDVEPAARREMKREENRVLRDLAKNFTFAGLAVKGAARKSKIANRKS